MTNQWQALQDNWLRIHHQAKMPEREHMISDLGIKPNSRIVDIGCGVGNFTALLAKHAINYRIIIGMDISHQHLLSAITEAQEYAFKNNVFFVQGDIHSLPFAKESYDLVWCANTLQYSPTPQKTLSCLQDLLVRGGILAVKDEDVIRDILLSWDPAFELAVVNAWSNIVAEMNDIYWDPYMARQLTTLFRRNNLSNIKSKTYVIERHGQLPETLAQYLQMAFWGYASRYKHHLSHKYWQVFKSYFDPSSSKNIFRRDDLHFIGTETVVVGEVQ